MAQKRNTDLVKNMQGDFGQPFGRLLLTEQYPSPGPGLPTTGGGLWDLKMLNTTILNNTIEADLAPMPAIILPRGIYEIEARAVGFQCDLFQLRLFDPVAMAVLASGIVANAPALTTAQVEASLLTRLAIAIPTVLQLEMAAQTASVTGQGAPSGFGTEVYSWLNIIKTG